MHLSLLSDAYLSDTLADSGSAAVERRPLGQAHRETLLRGLVVVAVFAVLMGLTGLCGTIPCAEAAKTLRTSAPAERAATKAGRLNIATPVKLADRVLAP